MLSDIIKLEFIEINGTVEDFEDAIRLSMRPLVSGEYVTSTYVDKIIEIYRSTGPYIVITKNTALPHAPGKYGALKQGISVTVLKDPVISGNEANDPVKYLFGLSAVNSENHLELMSKLVGLFSDPQFFSNLDKAKSEEEVYNLIKKYEEE